MENALTIVQARIRTSSDFQEYKLPNKILSTLRNLTALIMNESKIPLHLPLATPIQPNPTVIRYVLPVEYWAVLILLITLLLIYSIVIGHLAGCIAYLRFKCCNGPAEPRMLVQNQPSNEDSFIEMRTVPDSLRTPRSSSLPGFCHISLTTAPSGEAEAFLNQREGSKEA